MPLIIGVAGAIATGKSRACQLMVRLGASHCDADTLVHQALPARVADLLWRAVCVVVAVAFLAALPKLWNYIGFLWRERTPALQWRLDYVYACFALFIAAAALRFAWEAVRRR